MAYTLTNNSPSAGAIAWTGVHIVFDGLDYAVADGNTTNKYVYWAKATPTVLASSATYPSLGSEDCIVFINKNGTSISVLDSEVLDGSLVVPGTITASAIAAGSITADKLSIGANLFDRVRVYGASTNVSGQLAASVSINGQIVKSSSSRGLTVFVYNRSTHAFVSQTTYDVYGSTTARDDLATALNALTSSSVVFIASYDAVSFDSTSDALRTALKRCGAGATINSLTGAARYPYALIGIPGIGEGNGIELVKSAATTEIASEVSCFWIDSEIQGLNSSLSALSKLTSTYIADGAIVTNKIASDAITTDKIAAHAVTATEIAANTITATEIASNAITSDLIQSNAITATKVAAGAISATKLTIGDTSNIYPDPDMMDDDFYTGEDQIVTTSVAGSGRRRLVLAVSTTAKTAYSEWFSISPSQEYFVELMVANDPTSGLTAGTCSAYIEWASLDASNVKTVVATSTIVASTASTVVTEAGRFGITYAAGSTVRRARFKFVRDAGGDRYATFGLPVCRLKMTGELIVDGAITAEKIKAGSITADRIQLSAITGDRIAETTITGAKIATNTITARTIAIGDFTNLANNGDFQGGSANWTLDANASILVDATNAYLGSNYVMKLNPITATKYSANENVFPCVAGETFQLTWSGKASAALTGNAYVYIRWNDKSGANLGSSNVGSVTTQTTYTLFDNKVTAPANAVTGQVSIAQANTANTAYIGSIFLRRKTNGNLIVDGTITTDKIAAGAITADKIAAGAISADNILVSDSVTSDKIAANAVTTNKIAANAITASQIAAGAVTADKIAANSITGDRIAASQTITSPIINGGSISGSTISIGSGNFAVDASGNVTSKGTFTIAKNGTGVAGVKLTQDRLDVYDASGVLKVRIGLL